MSFPANVKNRLMPVLQKVLPTRSHYLRKQIFSHETVLDLGCGCSSPLQYCSFYHSTGVDAHVPYLTASKQNAIHNEYITGDIRNIEFQPKSFDVVIAFAVLEHLPKEEGYEMIKKMEKWARKKVIINTPNGYVEQEEYDNNIFQEHHSGWTADDFKQLGFDVYGCGGLKSLRGMGGIPKLRPHVFMEVLQHLIQPLVHHSPNLTFDLFAVKRVD
jgi:SAM-dependent methyltransferase